MPTGVQKDLNLVQGPSQISYALKDFLDGKYQLADPKMFDGLSAMNMKDMTKKYLLDVYCDDTNMILATFLDPR